MTDAPCSLLLRDADHAARFARHLTTGFAAGDTLLLDGPIGAGKTHFARSVIQAKLAEVGLQEEVPSPTFTLVQTYQADGLEIWHADLYRLTGPDQVRELGLEEAIGKALCLIEWPDRLAHLAPPDALHLRFEPTPEDQRQVTVTGPMPRWSKIARLIQDFDNE